MSFSCKKGKFDRYFNRLDRPVEESRPDRQPDRPVDPTGAGRPDRFPSLDRASATKAVDWSSVTCRVKPNALKISIHSFSALRSALKNNSMEPPSCVGDR